MNIVIISFGMSDSFTLVKLLSSKINIISENYLYPSELLKKKGKNVKVIFIIRNIKDIIKIILERAKDKIKELIG